MIGEMTKEEQEQVRRLAEMLSVTLERNKATATGMNALLNIACACACMNDVPVEELEKICKSYYARYSKTKTKSFLRPTDGAGCVDCGWEGKRDDLESHTCANRDVH